jgi:selenocysteine lyase/cysteine desulfurase
LIDGTQSIGALPFDVSAVQPDLLVTTGYKWLMGPYGLSVAYVGPRFDGGQPLEEVWTSQQDSDDFARLTVHRDAYRPLGARYDGGERASFVLAPMLTAAIDQIAAWGVASIQRYCAELLAPWRDTLFSEAGGEEDGRAAHLIGVRVGDGGRVARLAERMRQRGVHVSVRGTVIRVAPNVYNEPADLEALCAGLNE